MACKLSSTVLILAKSTDQRLGIGNSGIQGIEQIMQTCDFYCEFLLFATCFPRARYDFRAQFRDRYCVANAKFEGHSSAFAIKTRLACRARDSGIRLHQVSCKTDEMRASALSDAIRLFGSQNCESFEVLEQNRRER